MGLGVPQSRSGCCGEKKNSFHLLGIEFLPSSRQPVATPAELPWIIFPLTQGAKNIKLKIIISQDVFHTGSHST